MFPVILFGDFQIFVVSRFGVYFWYSYEKYQSDPS
jgi:hypothetical protein